ncbi:hypothetical protein [Streptomyces alfalfae]
MTQLERPKPGEPGVVRLDVFSGSRAKKMRVRLKVEDYDLAVDAHRNNLALRIRGRQEVEGRYFWLYDPEILEFVQIRPEASGVTVEPGEQEGLF